MSGLTFKDEAERIASAICMKPKYKKKGVNLIALRRLLRMKFRAKGVTPPNGQPA